MAKAAEEKGHEVGAGGCRGLNVDAVVEAVWDELDSLIGAQVSRDEVKTIIKGALAAGEAAGQHERSYLTEAMAEVCTRNVDLSIKVAELEAQIDRARDWWRQNHTRLPVGLGAILGMHPEPNDQ